MSRLLARPGRRSTPPLVPGEAALRRQIAQAGGSPEPRRPQPIWREWTNQALRSKDQVDAAIAEVRRIGLVPHPDAPKNWDLLVALGSILEATSPKRGAVLEMGAARYSPLLVWLYQYGYRELHGIDLSYPEPFARGPIRFAGMDLTKTTFADASFDAIGCLSVVEHGVDLDAYLAEAKRLLRPGGVLVTSTDYWADPVDTSGREAYGQPVRIFDRPSIEAFLESATVHGFTAASPADLDCRDRVVHWERVGLDYTFVVLVHAAPGRRRRILSFSLAVP